MIIAPLPKTYRRKDGVYRIEGRRPYCMRGELTIVTVVQGYTDFPETSFRYGQSQPLELVRLVPEVTLLEDATTIISPTLHANISQTRILQQLRIRIKDSRPNKAFVTPARLGTLLDKETGAWDFNKPYYMEASNTLIVSIQRLLTVAGMNTGDVGGVFSVPITGFTLSVTFHGSTLILGERVE